MNQLGANSSWLKCIIECRALIHMIFGKNHCFLSEMANLLKSLLAELGGKSAAELLDTESNLALLKAKFSAIEELHSKLVRLKKNQFDRFNSISNYFRFRWAACR